MSKATKNKYVTKEVLEEFVLPGEDQEVCRVLSSRGNNLHLVENGELISYLVSMPNKFRKRIWIKRGDFVIVDPIVEGDKVKGEIVNILYSEQIKYIKSEKKWPELFVDAAVEEEGKGGCNSEGRQVLVNGGLRADDSDSESSNDDDDLFVNPNHINRPYYSEEDDDDSYSESSGEDETDSSDHVIDEKSLDGDKNNNKKRDHERE